jgi:hypothetical protein
VAVTRGEERARRMLERAREFRRFARGDLEAIATRSVPRRRRGAPASQPLRLAGPPDVPARSHEAYRRDGQAA